MLQNKLQKAVSCTFLTICLVANKGESARFHNRQQKPSLLAPPLQPHRILKQAQCSQIKKTLASFQGTGFERFSMSENISINTIFKQFVLYFLCHARMSLHFCVTTALGH